MPDDTLRQPSPLKQVDSFATADSSSSTSAMESKVKTYSTKEVGKLLGVPTNYIQQLVWKDSLDAPEKCGRNYRWNSVDIEKASWKIRGRSADDVLPSEQEEPETDAHSKGHCETKQGVFEALLVECHAQAKYIFPKGWDKYWRGRYAKAGRFGKSHDVTDLYEDFPESVVIE